MANRHLSRSLAMQSLFEWDFRGAPNSAIEEIVRRVSAEFAPGLDEPAFASNLTLGVIAKKDKLDDIIVKAAPDWPIEQIAVVDRNVLRLGLYELLFGDRKQVPARVAINEAIELAKTFGGENSGRFVNGVLGAVYKEMGEPDKDEVPKKKKIKDIPYEEMPIEKLSGAVVYKKDANSFHLALVHDVFGRWTLSKGHIEEGEDVKTGTVREVKEELSLKVEPEAEIGFNEYVASDPKKGKIRKQVTYYLARALNPTDLKLAEDKGGLDNVRWFPLADIADLNMYDDIVPIITKALTLLLAKKKKIN